MFYSRVLFTCIVILLTSSFTAAQVTETPPTNDLNTFAKELFSAPSNNVRQTLIKAHQDLITKEFFKALITLTKKDRDNARGIETIQYVLSIPQSQNDKEILVDLNTALGGLFLRNDQSSDAEKTFEVVRKILPSIEKTHAGKALFDVGDVYMAMGIYDKSFLWFSDAKNALEDIQTKEAQGWLAESWRGIGVFYSESGNYDQALKALGKAENLFTQTENKAGLSSVMNDYGVIYDLKGNKSGAERTYYAAIDLLKTLDVDPLWRDQRIALIKVNIGLLQTISLGRYAEALQNFNEAEPFLDTPSTQVYLGMLYGNKAIALRRTGRLEEGLKYSRMALDKFKSDSYASANSYIELALAQLDLHKYDETLQTAEEAIKRTSNLRELKWMALTTKGRAFLAKKQFTEAKTAFDEAITIVDDLTDEAVGDPAAQAVYFGEMIYPYQYMVDLLVQQGKPEEALLYAEKSKAKSLLRSLQGESNNLNKGMTDSQKTDEANLIKQLTEVSVQISEIEHDTPTPTSDKDVLLKKRDDLRQKLEDFRSRLYRSVPDLSSRRVDLAVKSLSSLDTLFPNNKVLGLHYVITPDSILLFTITRGLNGKIKVKGQSLHVDGLELKQRTDHFRSYLTKEALGGFNEDASWLYEKLLKPVETELKGKETVVIVPDNFLWDLPFQALLDQRQKYFIEDHAISYVPSFLALSRIKESRRFYKAAYKTPLLAFGNPDLGIGSNPTKAATTLDENLQPIPQAEKLVTELCGKFSSCKNSTFIGPKATESEFKDKASQARIILLATHGILDNTSPLYSHIVLSRVGNNGKEDGNLDAWELMNLNLKSTEMLVLSACETARGEVRQGEGLIGLTWAAFIAGTPTTVASQWKVDADSTEILMKDFYNNLFPDSTKNLKANRLMAMSKVKAMQQAQKAMISFKTSKNSKYTHPYYWAGFIVVGDGQ